MAPLRDHFIPLLFYLFLILFIFQPLLGSLASTIPSFEYLPAWDACFFFWTFWNNALNLPASALHSDMILYPHGANLISSVPILLPSLLSLPFQQLFGLYAAFNFTVLLSFILSGYFAFLLCRHFKCSYAASLLGGAAFAFSPYHFAHLMQLNLVSFQWIPFFMLFFFRNLKEQSKKNQLLLALSFALNLYTCEMYALILLFFAAFWLIYTYVEKRGGLVNCTLNLQTLKEAFFTFPAFAFEEAKKNKLALAAVFLLCLPLLLLMAYEGIFTDYGLPPFYYTLFRVGYSAEPLAYFLPNPQGFIYRGATLPLYLLDGAFGANIQETNVSLGYMVLAFALFAVFSLKNDRSIKFLLYSSLFFFFLSLGPIIKFFGAPLLPSPSELFFFFPVIGHFRVPARFAVMVMLFAAVLFSIGLTQMSARLSANRRRLLAVAVFLILALEFYPYKLETTSFSVPSFVHTLKSYPNSTAILNLPITESSQLPSNVYDASTHNYLYTIYTANYVYQQTIHEKKMLNGVLSRYPLSAVQEFDKDYMKQLMFFNITNASDVRDSLKEAGATHIVFHKNAHLRYWGDSLSSLLNKKPEPSQFTDTDASAQLEKLGFPVVYEDNYSLVFKVE